MNLLELKEEKRNYSQEEYQKAETVYNSCEHLFICTQIRNCDGAALGFPGEIREEREYKCIKCGLDPKCGLPRFGIKNLSLSSKVQIMTEYFRKNKRSFTESESDIVCDFNLARAIYFKIKESHPDIDDEKIVQYMKTALEDMRNIKVNEERKENRAKRLSLDSQFNRWDSDDVYPHPILQLVKRFPEFYE